jgi:hypothetical protein
MIGIPNGVKMYNCVSANEKIVEKPIIWNEFQFYCIAYTDRYELDVNGTIINLQNKREWTFHT